MTAWTRIQGDPNQKEAFTRPLGLLESRFYWDSVCAGISDTLQHLTLETLPSESTSLEPFSSENVTRAWLATKKLHPLLGAVVQERPDESGLDFVVDEAHLGTVKSDEIVFITVQSDEEACSIADNIMNGPRRLSQEMLAQLWVISFPRHIFNSSPVVCYQCFIHLAHSIHDASAQSTIVKTFFDILVHSSTPEKYIPKYSLENRLMLHLAIDDLSPSRRYSIARQRWRLAIARVIHNRMTAACSGGHSLPRTITPLTVKTLPISRTLRLGFSKEVSKHIIKSCRQAGITFGNALPVLAQLAHARVLHRLYAQGAIPESEWSQRITQPMHFAGPMNLRPYLNQDWLAAGGADLVCTAISYYRNTLPAMPVPQRMPVGLVEEMPPFEAFLSGPRFIHRCRIIKKQTTGYLSHPLQTEFARIIETARLQVLRLTALDWRAQFGQIKTKASTPSSDTTTNEYVLSNACSTVGDMTQAVPAEYPLEGAPTFGGVHITSIRQYLRCRPAELYITSVSYQQQLRLVVFCDTRTYSEELVREWLSNVGQAIECYLGGATRAKL